MIDAKKSRGRKLTIKDEEDIFLDKDKKIKSSDDDDDEDDEERAKKSISKKKKSSKDEDDEDFKEISKKKLKKNKSEKKQKKGKKIEGSKEKNETKKKQKKESKKKLPIEGPKFVDLELDGEVRENKEKEEEEDRQIEKQKEKEKKRKQKKQKKQKEKQPKKKNQEVSDNEITEINTNEEFKDDAKKFKELQEIANKDIKEKNDHDKDEIDESYYYNAELDTTPPNPKAHSGPNEGILADGTFNTKEELEAIAKNLEKENKNLEAINHRNSLNNIQDQFSKNNVQNPVVSDASPSFSGNDADSNNLGGDLSKDVDSSPDDGWSDLGGLEKVEEIEKEDQLNRENNPNQKSTEEEYPELQLEREQLNLKENSRFKYFKLTPDQERRAKDLIDNGFEMLNTSTIFQVSFQSDSADKENSELCIFKLDEKSTQSNENRSNFAKLDSLLQQHFTEEKVLRDGESLTLPKTKCYDKLEIDSRIDGEFSKVNFQIFNPQSCTATSSFVLQTTKAFYVIPLSFKKNLSVTLTYLPQSELNEILADGYRTFFLDDNKFIEVLSSYWLIQTV